MAVAADPDVAAVAVQYVDENHHTPGRVQQRAVSAAAVLHTGADPSSLAWRECEVPWVHSSGQRDVHTQDILQLSFKYLSNLPSIPLSFPS